MENLDLQQNPNNQMGKVPEDNFNANIYQDKKENNISSINNNEEISKLKNEIQILKNGQNKHEEIIKQITKDLKNEIASLKLEIQKLTKELNELKSRKGKSRNDDEINNISNENIDNNDDEEMDYDETYSIQCLSRKLNIEIVQGAERASTEVVVKNNSGKKFPNDSFLICDNKNSLLLCEKVHLGELEPGHQKVVTILFKNLKFISKGKYRCVVKLQINNKIYNSFFEIFVEVLNSHQNENIQRNNFQANFVYPQGIAPGGNFGNLGQEQNMQDLFGFNNNSNDLILRFKEQFNLYNNDLITDEKIERALINNQNDFIKAFESLYDN